MRCGGDLSGNSSDCPADLMATVGTVCRPAIGPCDVAESCTGSTVICPPDAFSLAGTVCRPSTDSNQCDPAESCVVGSGTCPADLKYPKPAAPSNVTATGGDGQVTVTWGAVGGVPPTGATSYAVLRSTTSGSGYVMRSNSSSTATSFIDTQVSNGTTYYYVVTDFYVVTASQGTCSSGYSNQATATPNAPPPPPPCSYCCTPCPAGYCC